MATLRKLHSTIISPVYEDNVDLTSTWLDRCHQDIFPSVYKRYRAPVGNQECEQMIQDLTEMIKNLNDQYEETRNAAYSLCLDPGRDRPTKDKLKGIRTARNRHEAIRRAYLHWLSIENNEPINVPVTGVTQFSTQKRIEILASTVNKFINIYLRDLSDQSNSNDLQAELNQLQKQLQVVFVESHSF